MASLEEFTASECACYLSTRTRVNIGVCVRSGRSMALDGDFQVVVSRRAAWIPDE